MIGEQNGLKFIDKGIVIKVPPSAYHLDYNISVGPSDIKFLENIPEGDHIMSIDIHKIEVLKKIWDDIDIQQNMTTLNYELADITLSNQKTYHVMMRANIKVYLNKLIRYQQTKVKTDLLEILQK